MENHILVRKPICDPGIMLISVKPRPGSRRLSTYYPESLLDLLDMRDTHLAHPSTAYQ